MLAAMLMSRRATLTLLRDMFGARISLGSVDTILKQASDALAAPWQAIQQAVQTADVAHADETSWARAGQRLWLWSALSATAACYRIDATRARSAARALLGDFHGLLITDRYSVYDFIDADRRQVCLGHLARNFQALAERPGACGRHGQAIRAAIDDAIRADTQARRDGDTPAWHTGPLTHYASLWSFCRTGLVGVSAPLASIATSWVVVAAWTRWRAAASRRSTCLTEMPRHAAISV